MRIKVLPLEYWMKRVPENPEYFGSLYSQGFESHFKIPMGHYKIGKNEFFVVHHKERVLVFPYKDLFDYRMKQLETVTNAEVQALKVLAKNNPKEFKHKYLTAKERYKEYNTNRIQRFRMIKKANA